jgi:hypothetical protein
MAPSLSQYVYISVSASYAIEIMPSGSLSSGVSYWDQLVSHNTVEGGKGLANEGEERWEYQNILLIHARRHAKFIPWSYSSYGQFQKSVSVRLTWLDVGAEWSASAYQKWPNRRNNVELYSLRCIIHIFTVEMNK